MGMTWGYVWGLWWWRQTGSNMDADRLRTDLSAIPAANVTSEDLKRQHAQSLRDRGLANGVPQCIPTDIVTSGVRPHVQNSRFVVHQWNGFIPLGSICKAGADSFVCSPELCLLQIAHNLRRMVSTTLKPWQYTVILSELVCELCGTYSKQNTATGFKGRNTPLTSIGQLTVFCGRVSFVHGANNLKKAIAWALDGLNSPMETVLYLLLCLPAHYGGLEFPRPLANYAIPVPRELWSKTDRRHIVPDLFWPEFGLIVEFNGEEPHRGHETQDQERQELAQDMGLFVITFRKQDLLNKARFLTKAKSAAKYLGHTLPEATEQFDELQGLLHDMLLRHERWV